VRYGSCGQVRSGAVGFGMVWYGTVRCGMAVVVWWGKVWCGLVRFGMVRQLR